MGQWSEVFSLRATSWLAGVFSFAVVIMPLTQLRIGYLGVGEILAFFCSLYVLVRCRRRLILPPLGIASFFLFFMLLSFCGLVFERILVVRADFSFELWAFDLFSYIFVFLVCLALTQLVARDGFSRQCCEYVFWFGSFLVLGLYFLSFFVDGFGGYTIRNYGNFSPLSENLHQTASFMLVLPFLGLYLKGGYAFGRSVVVCFIVVFLSVAVLDTASFKAFLGLVLGFLFYFYFFLFRFKSWYFSVGLTLVVFTVFGLLCFFLGWVDFAFEVFQEQDKGGARHAFWSLALGFEWYFYVIGGGFGPHVYYGGVYHDAHQTLLTILLQGGFFSVVYFVFVMARIYWESRLIPAVFCACISILPYIMGGDVLRRLPIWIALILLVGLIGNEKKRKAVL